ncbi:type VI secretion system accessory protein TagJ [Erwinia amylovora]
MFEIKSLSALLLDSSLDEAMNDARVRVKYYPEDLQAHELLFKLYCLDFQWEKALSQLETMMLIDNEFRLQGKNFKALITGEIKRMEVLSGRCDPAVITDNIPEWIQLLHQGNKDYHAGDISASETAHNKAFSLARECGGEGRATGVFSWISDSDGRIGPVCEFISSAGYQWIPFSEIQSMRISKPENLTDLLWIKSSLVIDDQVYSGYQPSRYLPGKNMSQRVKLGHQTEWEEISPSFVIAKGRKMYITDAGEYSLFDIQDVTLNVAE